MRFDFISHLFKHKSLESFDKTNEKDLQDDFAAVDKKTVTDPYLQHAWVSIAVDLVARNIGRAEFEVRRDGEVAKESKASKLFDAPNPTMSRFDLWKQTVSWWELEGEAFWWFGSTYSCGVPDEIYILNPRHMQHVVSVGRIVKWVYTGDNEYGPFTMLADEVIHFKQWNPWNRWRGVCPLVSLDSELEQDVLACRQNTNLLKEGGIPKGLLKTDQIITEPEADEIEKRWEEKYGKGQSRKIAVVGKGTNYQQLTFSPDVLKLYDLKKWNLFTVLAKYGIPPRVANIQDEKSSLSGTDTQAQHEAFWLYTLVPILQNFEQSIEVQFFRRFNLKERGKFNLSAIPELQESEDAQSKRDIEEINAGLKTINDVLIERGKPVKTWGDVWYRPSNLVITSKER